MHILFTCILICIRRHEDVCHIVAATSAFCALWLVLYTFSIHFQCLDSRNCLFLLLPILSSVHHNLDFYKTVIPWCNFDQLTQMKKNIFSRIHIIKYRFYLCEFLGKWIYQKYFPNSLFSPPEALTFFVTISVLNIVEAIQILNVFNNKSYNFLNIFKFIFQGIIETITII